MTIYSIPFSLITTFFISYAFELLGRKLTISLSYATTALCYLILPHTKPHFWLLAVVRCAIGVTMAGPISHPLINDYVRKNSRGKAIALNGLGQVFGEVMAMGVLLKLSKRMTYEQAFAMTSSIILFFSFFFCLFVKNPNLRSIARRIDRKHGKQRSSLQIKVSEDGVVKGQERQPIFQELTLVEKVAELTTIVKRQLAKKPILYIVIMGAAITRLLAVLFSTYLILWINQSYQVTNEMSHEEAIEQRGKAKDIYINIMVASALICVFFLPAIGKICDIVDPRNIMPIAFLARCSTTYLFWLLKKPAGTQTFVVCVSMVVATIAEQICCDSIFMKNLNKETRGILSGAYSFVGQVGTLFFSLIGGWMFDNLGSKSPFVAIGFLDFGFTIVFCAFMLGQRGAQESEGRPTPTR